MFFCKILIFPRNFKISQTERPGNAVYVCIRGYYEKYLIQHGECAVSWGGKCPPGKCLTIPLYYGKVQISNKFLKCGQCCAFQKCNQTTLVSACLRTKPPKNSIHPETRHIQPINVLDDDRRIEVCR